MAKLPVDKLDILYQCDSVALTIENGMIGHQRRGVREVELCLLSTRDNALIFFSLTCGSSSVALREVVRVKRCQSFGEIDDGVEVGTEAAPSMEVRKDNLRKLDDARFGMGMGTGTVECGKSGTPSYAGGDAGNDVFKLEDCDSPFLVAWACDPERRNPSFSRS